MMDAERIELEARRLVGSLADPHERITARLENHPPLRAICYDIKGRIKRVERIVEKVLDRHKGGRTEYTVAHITDASGFRLIALFQNDVAVALRQMLSFAGTHQGALFRAVREIKFYTSRPVSDPLSIEREVEKAVDDCGYRGIYTRESKDSLYSSVHIVMDLDVDAGKGSKQTVGVEFQIRSAFEEVWGEIEHKLRYSANRGAIDSTSWGKHLNALKALTDGLIQYVEVIRGQAMAGSSSIVRNDDTVAAGIAETVLHRLTNIKGMPATYAESLRAAFDLRDRTKGLVTEIERVPAFKDGIQKFRLLLGDVDQPAPWLAIPPRTDVDELRYWLRLELAYCLMHGDGDSEEGRQNLDEADRIYAEIESEVATDAVSRFRRAQVLRRKNQFGASVDRYRAALAVIDSDPRIGRDHWINAGALHRDLGFAQYIVAMEGMEPAANLKRAIDSTTKAFALAATDRDQQLCLNNLVYYFWEARERGDVDIDEDLFRRSVDDLRAMADTKPPFPVHTSYDTLCRCYMSLGQTADAAEMARRSRDVLGQAVRVRAGLPADALPSKISCSAPKCLSVDEIDAWVYAMEVLRGYPDLPKAD